MKDELIALAKEAGHTIFNIESTERFAALVAAKEREKCAILVEYLDLYSGDRLKNSDPRTTCAEAIRARKP